MGPQSRDCGSQKKAMERRRPREGGLSWGAEALELRESSGCWLRRSPVPCWVVVAGRGRAGARPPKESKSRKPSVEGRKGTHRRKGYVVAGDRSEGEGSSMPGEEEHPAGELGGRGVLAELLQQSIGIGIIVACEQQTFISQLWMTGSPRSGSQPIPRLASYRVFTLPRAGGRCLLTSPPKGCSF